jgi:DNA-binding transcriptional LysR family regulator
MRLDWLNAFRAVIQTGTVTGAASVMLRTQPQVSRMIASLEKSLGLTLFHREGRRLVPTEEAAEFNLSIEPILHALDGMRDVAQDIKHKRGRRVVISAEPFHLHALAPEAIALASRANGNLKCALEISMRGLGLWISRSNADLAIVALPFTQTDMQQVPFAQADVVAVLPPGHPLTKRKIVDMRDLAKERFIALRPSTLLRAQIDIAASRAGVMLNTPIEVTSGVSSCEFVARGLGVTIADPVVASSFVARGVALRPLSAGLRLTYGFLVPRLYHSDHPVHLIMRMVASSAEKLGAPYVKLEPGWETTTTRAAGPRKVHSASEGRR